MLLWPDFDINYCLLLCEQPYTIDGVFVTGLERLQLKDWKTLKELKWANTAQFEKDAHTFNLHQQQLVEEI